MKRGLIVLTPFPFADLSDHKVRPALLVSRSERIGSEVILAFIGTHKGHRLRDDDLLLSPEHTPQFEEAGLKAASFVRLAKLLTVQQGILRGKLGTLPPEIMLQVDEKLRFALDLIPADTAS